MKWCDILICQLKFCSWQVETWYCFILHSKVSWFLTMYIDSWNHEQHIFNDIPLKYYSIFPYHMRYSLLLEPVTKIFLLTVFMKPVYSWSIVGYTWLGHYVISFIVLTLCGLINDTIWWQTSWSALDKIMAAQCLTGTKSSSEPMQLQKIVSKEKNVYAKYWSFYLWHSMLNVLVLNLFKETCWLSLFPWTFLAVDDFESPMLTKWHHSKWLMRSFDMLQHLRCQLKALLDKIT